MAGTAITGEVAKLNPVAAAGSRPNTLKEIGQLAWIALQLALVILLSRAFNIENSAFYQIVLPLAAGGFVVHHWLPRSYQPMFFAALSIAGIFLIFGWVAGAWLVAVGLGLIALCHLPIAFRWRVALVLLAGAGLVAMRSAWLTTPWPGVIWPILGSMFMFRLAMYLYDLKHRGPASPGFVLSYFFLLPNSVFLLFPVIDFQTFRRTHYDKPAFEIYGEGVRWMFRGLTHLVIYRLIYQYVALSPADVTSTATLVQYLVANYGLYLRVSGQFHIIVGLLHLFGFRLPETHRFFYLASSFSDLWRRINIYWKDFMQKMVYLPVVFGLKSRGETTALVGATISVVGATWFLHSYQWFWLLGTWLFSGTDMVFWGVLGVLLIANTLREQRRGRARQLTAQAAPAGEAWRHAVQTAGMFALMAVLWGFWTSPTFEDFELMLRATTLRPLDLYVVAGTLGVVALAAFLTRRFSLGAPSALAVRPRWQHPLVVSAVPLALVWVVAEPVLSARVPAVVQTVARQARVVELNKFDAERLQRGYYEKIVGVNRYNGQLWELYARGAKPQGTDLAEGTADANAYVDEFGNRGYPPFLSRGRDAKLFTTNRWGFRDKDYEKEPPPGTRRIAVLGPSYVVGTGVKDGEPFEALVEERLNREWSQKSGLKYELLNFGLGSSSIAEQAKMLSSGRISQFKPDVVLLIGHINGERQIGDFLWQELRQGKTLPDSMRALVTKAGVAKGMSQSETQRLLRPLGNELVQTSLRDAYAAVRHMGAKAFFALVPMPYDLFELPEKAVILDAAGAAGFKVIDMQDVYEGYDAAPYVVDVANHHPNKSGHQLTAERLFAELMRYPEILAAHGNPAAVRAQADWFAEWTEKRNKELTAMRALKPRDVLLAEAKLKQAEGLERKRQPTFGPWRLNLNGGAKATLQLLPNSTNGLRVTIDAVPESLAWHVKLREAPLALKQGIDYRLSFRVRADAPRPLAVGAEGDVEPFRFLGFYRDFDATTEWKTHEFTFSPNLDDPNARLFFDLGLSKTSVEFSQVVIAEASSGRVVDAAITTPATRRELRRQAPDTVPERRLEDAVWRLEASDGATAKLEKVSRAGGGYRVSIAGLPAAGGHLRVRSGPLAVVEGRQYRLSFRVKADASRPLTVAMEETLQPRASVGLRASLNVTRSWQTFERTFTATSTRRNARIGLDLAMDKASIDVSNVVLIDVVTGKEVPVARARR